MKLAWTVALAAGAVAVSAQEYPLRVKYPQLVPISTTQLAQELGKSTVVDVRSAFEFSVMHIDGAVHVDFSDPAFVDNLAKVVAGDKTAGLITYCNGITCEKSYEAAAAAVKGGFTNVRVYDAGILEWARMARGRTLLFGKPIQPEHLIPDSRYQEHMLDAEAFEKGAGGAEAVLIDVRDAQQREKTAAFAQKADWITVDHLVKQLGTPVFRSRTRAKTLYIFDNVGKQVRWVQYALEAQGYTQYYFLKGGMTALVGGR